MCLSVTYICTINKICKCHHKQAKLPTFVSFTGMQDAHEKISVRQPNSTNNIFTNTDEISLKLHIKST